MTTNSIGNKYFALIVSGGIGDVLIGLAAAQTLLNCGWSVTVYVNSHNEIFEFVKNCTYFNVEKCPERNSFFKDPENPLNLPKEFLDSLFKKYSEVYSCFPDSLGQAPFAFPWFKYFKNYKEFLRMKIVLKFKDTKFITDSFSSKHIVIHATSITIEKNYQLTSLQRLINLLNTTNYNVIICRTSSWKGAPLPFFCQGKYNDAVDLPIEDIVSIINNADYFVGIDSGLAHIAYHLGIPRIVLQQQYNQPFHISRYHEDCTDDMPLTSSPEELFHRIVLNIREPLTYSLPAYMGIPYNSNVKQLLYKKYYD